MNSHAPRRLNREKMRELYKEGYCIEEISRQFKCRPNAVMHHIYDLTIPCLTMVRTNSKLTKRQVQSIRKSFINKNESAALISRKFEVSPTTILNIVHGVFYRWVPGEIVDNEGVIWVIPEGFHMNHLSNKKGARKSGPNKYTERKVKSGALIPLAKKHKVAICTISRWMRKGKMDVSGKLLNSSKVK
jgi:hypothetical protein